MIKTIRQNKTLYSVDLIEFENAINKIESYSDLISPADKQELNRLRAEIIKTATINQRTFILLTGKTLKNLNRIWKELKQRKQ